MAWLRIGDNAATHPLMSRLLTATDYKHPQKNEAFGALVQLAAVSAGHLTDAVVEMGLLAQIAPGRERAILDTLKRAGLATVDEADGSIVIRLVLDDEEFIHARRKEEVEIDRRRAKDKRTPGLLAQVRVRDGDRCRWAGCGRSVSWTNRSGHRAATYDSLNSHMDSTADTLVIACKSCNDRRSNGVELTLLDPPTPEEIVYGKQTVEFVNTDQWCQDHGIHIELTQPTLPLDTDTQAAAARQQQDDQTAAPTKAAASGHRAAPKPAAPGDGKDPVEPPWMTMTLDELHPQTTPGAAPTAAAAQGEPAAAPTAAAAQARVADSDQAAVLRQQQDDLAAAPTAAAASGHRAAPKPAAPAPHHPPCNEEVTELGRDPGRLGDAAGNVGSGRAGSGREGQGRAGSAGSGRRRRGKRGGRKS